MAPLSILVVGSTGNTGSPTVKCLSHLMSSSSKPYRIIALTRDASSDASQQLARLSHVDVQEKDWTCIDSAWLVEANVSRVYLAPHNLPSQFIDESKFLIACRDARVQYLVKLSTNTHYVTPDNPVYYGRVHWAIETLLEQAEFQSLNWTVLRANYFLSHILAPSIDWLKKNPNGEAMPLLLNEDTPVALIHPADVGEAAGKLLSLDEPSMHFKKKYVLSGPEDVTGRAFVSMLEEATHREVRADYGNLSLFQALVEKAGYPESVRKSLDDGRRTNLWKGLSRLENTLTDPALLTLAPPHSTAMQFIQKAFNP